MKFVNFCQNFPEPRFQGGRYCLHACLKMATEYLQSPKKYNIIDIDSGICPSKGYSWLVSGSIWLKDQGLDVKLIYPSSFDYLEFSKSGLSYLKTIWDQNRINNEQKNGGLDDLDFIQNKCKILVQNNLWLDKAISDQELAMELQDKNKLAIGKTGEHFKLIIEKNQNSWIIHDPGLPAEKYQKNSNDIQNIFGEILLISK